MRLDVYIENRLIGVLEQPDINKYVFTYAPHAAPEDCISLLMPVRTESWVHYGSVHPVFQVSLPEGVLRAVLERKCVKMFDRFGDMELLATIGAHLIGRLRVVQAGSPLQTGSPSQALEVLLSAGSEAFLDQFMDIQAQYSGVSGAFPKVLAKSPTGRSASADRSTLFFDKWIVKTSSDDTPGLVLNEFFGLRLAQNVGLEVPEYRLSDDAKRLLIKRFDIDEQGNHLGFEDMCALTGRPSVEKFTGSVERIINTLNELCPPREAARARDAFFLQYLTCMAMRNGDAHMKNFGLLYDHPKNARLSPAYDLVTMCAYAPRDAQTGDAVDMPALTFGGVRRWPTAQTFKALADRCLIGTPRRKQIVAQVVSGFLVTGQELVDYVAEQGAAFSPVAKRLLELWSCGVRLHSSDAAQDLWDLAQTIECDPEGEPVYVKPERVRY